MSSSEPNVQKGQPFVMHRRIDWAHFLIEGLVVAGSILIAFALDAWWSQRATERTEAAHVRAISSDFQQNVSRLRGFVALEEGIMDASRRLLLVVSAADIPAREDSLNNLLGQVFNSGRFEPVLGAYEAVVSSGGLAQLTNDSLRLALADFASFVEGRYAERYSDELYFDFVRSVTGRLGWADVVLQSNSNPVHRNASAQRSARQLLTDPDFRDRLALRYFAERDVAQVYRALLSKAERVLDLTGQGGNKLVGPAAH
jgi:hypothetical protein